MAHRAHRQNDVENDVAARTERPLDRAHLARQCLGDVNLEREVMALFETTIATYASRLRAARSDAERGVNLHALRSAASGVGAWSVVELAIANQRLLETGEPMPSEAIDDIVHAIEEVRAFIVRILADNPLI